MSIKKTAATLAAIFAAPASAALIVVDPTHFADDAVKQNLVVFDDENNLFWHKLTPTVGLTHQFVTSQFAEGGQFEGMRVASLDEVSSMFTQAGLPTTNMANTISTPEQLSAAVDLQQLFGFYTQGIVNPLYSTNGMTSIVQFGELQAAASIVTGYQNRVNIGISALSSVMEFDGVGHWLVYEGTYTPPSNDNGNDIGKVPEPGTLALLATGLAIGAGISRREKKAEAKPSAPTL